VSAWLKTVVTQKHSVTDLLHLKIPVHKCKCYHAVYCYNFWAIWSWFVWRNHFSKMGTCRHM